MMQARIYSQRCSNFWWNSCIQAYSIALVYRMLGLMSGYWPFTTYSFTTLGPSKNKLHTNSFWRADIVISFKAKKNKKNWYKEIGHYQANILPCKVPQKAVWGTYSGETFSCWGWMTSYTRTGIWKRKEDNTVGQKGSAMDGCLWTHWGIADSMKCFCSCLWISSKSSNVISLYQ